MLDLAQRPCMDTFAYGPMWIWGGITVAVLLAVGAAVVWFLVSRRTHEADQVTAPARRILADRFARGEITAEEYRQQLDTLR